MNRMWVAPLWKVRASTGQTNDGRSSRISTDPKRIGEAGGLQCRPPDGPRARGTEGSTIAGGRMELPSSVITARTHPAAPLRGGETHEGNDEVDRVLDNHRDG